MNKFSISELQQFSGVKAHTIRIWEQRYGALRPNRSEGNTRYYSGAQLKRLLNIVSLMGRDERVSELCKLSDEKLDKLLLTKLRDSEAMGTTEYFISQIVAAALEFDEYQFDKMFSNGLVRFDLRTLYVEILYPALKRLGLMWAASGVRPAHEHFITNLMRQKLMAAIDALPPARSSETWLLFLPENEFHEVGLLFASFLIRQSGRKVIYLGADVPLDVLVDAAKNVKPRTLLFFLVRENGEDLDKRYLQQLHKAFPGQRVLAACNSERLSGKKLPMNLGVLQSVEDLEKQLTA